MNTQENPREHESFDPKTITYLPHPGGPTPTRTREQLLQGAEHYGIELESTPDGFMATMEQKKDGFPSLVDVWDKEGRLIRSDFINNDTSVKVGVTDRTGDLKGETSPLFSNVYTYDDTGRLIRSAQVVTQNDFQEYTYREDVFTYADDGSYTKTHNENSAPPVDVAA